MKIAKKKNYDYLKQDKYKLNNKTKKELKERMKNPKLISHEKIGKKLK